MVKKIGNILWVCLLLLETICTASSVQIQFQLVDNDGAALKKAEIGVPFFMHVTASGDVQEIQSVKIGGAEQFHIENRGSTTQMTTINGVMSLKKKYSYLLQSDAKGVFTIGPVEMQVQGQWYRSTSVKIEVVERELRTDKRPFLTLLLDRDEAFVGQTVQIGLRFYTDPDAQLVGIEPPSFTGFELGKLHGPFSGSQEIDGQEVPYIEWRAPLIAKQVGTVTISPAKALYKVQKKDRGRYYGDVFGAFADVFDLGVEQRVAYSNSHKIHINPLPAYDGTVDAVGVFSSLAARVNQQKAQQGEGVVYALDLVGTEGDFEKIAAPALQMPAAVKFYDSKSIVHEKTKRTEPFKKTFEYIVQALEPGDIEIPAQEFTYFDTQDHAYKKLHTQSLHITILPTQQEPAQQPQAPVLAETLADGSAHTILPLDEEGALHAIEQFSIPFTYFWIVIFTILLVICLGGAYRAYNNYYQRNYLVLRKKYAYSVARTALNKAQANNKPTEIYTIFITFFADMLMVPPADISADSITTYLRDRTFSATQRASWDEFFIAVQEINFSQTNTYGGHAGELFTRAQEWLALIGKKV